MLKIIPLTLKPNSAPIYTHGVNDKYFNFQYYNVIDEQFDILTGRWLGREETLNKIAVDITHDKHNWCDVLTPHNASTLPNISPARGGYDSSSGKRDYHRDLRGLTIENLHAKSPISALDWAFFDWCVFNRCSFSFSAPYKIMFFYASLSNCKFSNCKFNNGWFHEGSMKNTVFYECEFDHVSFNENSHEKTNYSNIIFMNCKFKNVDFSKIDLNTTCFTGNCEFSEITIDNEDLMSFSTIGKNLLKTFRKWDSENWKTRRKIKSVSYIGSAPPAIELLNPGEKKAHKHKYRSLQSAIIGMIRFYEHIAKTRDNHTSREVFSRTHYVLSLLIDKNRALSNPLKGFLKSFPGRYITGYGDRPETPIIAWLVAVIFFAAICGVSGIKIDDIDTSFETVLAAGDLKGIIKFTLECVYFSFITATTVGYGDITRTPGPSMLFSAMNAAIGMFLYTTFTVVIVRRLLR